MQLLTSQIANARHKRERVIDTFLDEVISREERNQRLATIDRDIQVAQRMLAEEKPAVAADLGTLAEALVPLGEWHFWDREQKRSLLSTLVPDIKVADYKVAALGLNPAIFSNEDTHVDTDSWPPPA
jgi:hypothetical protein